MQLHQFKNTLELNQDFTSILKSALNQAIKERGHAYIAVSGGKTPASLFLSLAQADINWNEVTITLCDDRKLPPSEQDSNERLLNETLLQGKAQSATFVSLFSTCEKDDDYLAEIESRFDAIPVFDVVILGMGEDGHTASLFPCSSEIAEGLISSRSVLFTNPTTAPYKRLSLTKHRLLNSRALFLHMVGDRKLHVLNKALEGDSVVEMPIRAFLQHSAPEIHVMFAPQ